MRLVDTHCHLADRRLARQTEEVLCRARRAGVRSILCAAGSLAEAKAAAELAAGHPEVLCMAGIHPHEAAKARSGYLQEIRALATGEHSAAVGEVGLDYHYDFSGREDQRRVFAEQLALAAELAKPVVVHTREAFEDTLAILRESGVAASRVVFHSFTGDVGQARRVLDFGASVSFSGILTFQRSAALRRAAALAPAERILLETDAPYLSPEPVRKMKINEPANVVHVARSLAAIRGRRVSQVAERTTANAARFFAFHPD